MAAGSTKTLTYTEGQFSDVPASEWYAKEVGNAYELGLMNGKGERRFDPDGNVTVAEALTVASRASAAYNGETIEPADGEWYQMYVNYAENKGMIEKGAYSAADLDRPAKRYEVAAFFAKALPKEAYAEKNDVTDIPDVTPSRSYYEDVMMLYKAGVVMGSDARGTFYPEHNITRAETAAIINRAALPENRLSKTLDKVSPDDAYRLAYNRDYNSWYEGIQTGWLLDNRGGSPRSDYLATYGALFDVSDQAGTAYIREFNKITTGVITLTTSASVDGGDGVSLEFRNDADEPVYVLKTADGYWCLQNNDGTCTKLYEIDPKKPSFSFKLVVDVDNARARTFINDTDCGTYPLLRNGQKMNILTFRFATDKEHTGAISPGALEATVNYALYGNQTAPKGEITTFPFDAPLGGDLIIDEFQIMPNRNADVSYSLMDGDREIVRLRADGTAFYVNETTVYEDYYHTLYYRFRLELDMTNCEVTVKVNGVEKAVIPFLNRASTIDSAVCDNRAYPTDLYLYWHKLYRCVEHDDYVPEPVIPAGADKYTIGMIGCNMWNNGYSAQGGWASVTPYDAVRPAIGYYDECSPETADWEIKYMVEHGVDFQALCIFFGNANAAEQLGPNHLLDGYMNAKYADKLKFAPLWENAGGQSPVNIDVFKSNYVPYMIENFFKHPNCMTIDNKPLLIIYRPSVLSQNFGGEAKVKEALDYLRNEVKKLGYEDMIILAQGQTAPAENNTAGFDGGMSYGWGTQGNDPVYQKHEMENSLGESYAPFAPTVGLGFSSFNGSTLISVSDHKALCEWVRDEYLPKSVKEPWQEGLVFLSTWNEFAEGYYYMPTVGGRGFGYLDNVMEVFTDEKPSAKTDVYPTENQLSRVTHLYPQYRRLLRRQRLEEIDDTVTYENIKYRGEVKPTQYWYCIGIDTDSVKVQNERVSGVSTGNDPIFYFTGFNNDNSDLFNLDYADGIELTIDAPKGSPFDMFYVTEKYSAVSADRGLHGVKKKDGVETIIVDASEAYEWTGNLKWIRVDPCASSDTPVAFLGMKLVSFTKEGISRDIYIDDNKTTLPVAPSYAPNGDMLVVFDPSSSMDFRLNCFHTYDSEKKELTLYFIDHTFVFAVGSDSYLLDGVKKSLGYKITAWDSLPLVPIEIICDTLSYSYSIDLKQQLCITTPTKAYYDKILSERKEGSWNFDIAGDPEGWNSDNISLIANGSSLVCSSNDVHDPRIKSAVLAMSANQFTKLEYRVRYSYTAETEQDLQMFFVTDTDGSWSEDKSFRARLKSKDSGGEWEVYTVDLTQNAKFKGVIKQLRFDPFNEYGTMEVDYIRFLE